MLADPGPDMCIPKLCNWEIGDGSIMNIRL